jgi:hypothetical protein
MNASKSVDRSGDIWKRIESRTWRRRLIVAMYAGYAALLAEVVVHEHLGRPWSPELRTPASLLFAFTVIVITISWGWMLSAAVRYGFAPRQRRVRGVAGLRALKAQGYSAREAMAMAASPPDERQQAVRNRAYAVAFPITAAVVMLGAIYAVLAIQVMPGLWLPHTSAEIWSIVTALGLMYSTLPWAILAWTEPEPLSEVTV